MGWLYVQRTGSLYFNGAKVANGYAGAGLGKNNPDLQGSRNVGPIPIGRWKIVGAPFDNPHTGLYCLRLEPNAGTDTLGRSGFLIHGDSVRKPGTASQGCIILPFTTRKAIYTSGDTDLTVVAEEPQADPVESLQP